MKISRFSALVKKEQTIYKGHDVSWYNDPAISLQEFNVPKEVLTTGCIVNDRRRKGPTYFIAAIDLLPKDLSIYFIFIGHVKDKELLDSIKQIRCCESIHLLGVQKKQQQSLRVVILVFCLQLNERAYPRESLRG
jgi:hypothetical protein